MADERRSSPRFLVTTKVRLESGRTIQRYTSINLSSGGVYLESESPLAIGAQVFMKFDFPDAGAVEAHGVVKHHYPFLAEDPGLPVKELRGMGIAFVRVEGDGAQALADQIKALTLKTS